MFKTFFNRVWDFFECIGYARAATTLAREGKYEEAKAVMAAKRSERCSNGGR
jgi:hypothetical protein